MSRTKVKKDIAKLFSDFQHEHHRRTSDKSLEIILDGLRAIRDLIDGVEAVLVPEIKRLRKDR